MYWIKKNPLGRDILPWEEITLDQLSPELRRIIAKAARASAKDFYEETRETLWEALSGELGKRVNEAINPALMSAQEAHGGSLEPVPVPEAECTGPHYCGISGPRRPNCRESCSACMYPAQPRPCHADHCMSPQAQEAAS